MADDVDRKNGWEVIGSVLLVGETQEQRDDTRKMMARRYLTRWGYVRWTVRQTIHRWFLAAREAR